MSPISSWTPSELDKQTQIAEQALARIAELKATIETMQSHYTDLLAGLAERDRMLQVAARERPLFVLNGRMQMTDDWLADLRARAKKGSDTCPPMSAR